MDDSGTRHPDHDSGRKPAHAHDWFGLGGVLIAEEDEELIRKAHGAFCARWGIQKSLRSADIRARHGEFAWLGSCSSDRREKFLEELYQLMSMPQLLGLACVIDRPGYNFRYLAKYGRNRWSLCKTAFAVSVERAAKFARRSDRRLRVLIERSDKKTDAWIAGYYESLKSVGNPFAAESSGKYAPLTPEEFTQTLFELRLKNKSSPIVQIADLYLWPMCIGGYDRRNRPYVRLFADGRLIDSALPPDAVQIEGIKYSCWDLVETSSTKQ
jgi:hypothetical protein